MKVIDLLNKIANGEEVPKKIRISFYDEGTPEIYNFTYNKNIKQYEDEDDFTLSSALNITLILNEEVEVIEEDKKIKKLPPSFYENACLTKQDVDVANKINEIIDYIMENKHE
jgi:hypothetical protein